MALLLLCNNTLADKKVPLEAFAAKSKFKSVKISPDAKHLAFTFEEGSEVKLGIMDMATKKGLFAFDVGDNREVSQFNWVSNKRIVFVSQYITGWLDGKPKKPEMKAVDIDGENAKMLHDFQRSGVALVSLLENEPDHVLVSKRHFADGGSAKLNKMNIHNGKMSYVKGAPNTVGGNLSRIFSIRVDHNDEPRVAVEYDPVDRFNFDDDVIYLHIRKSGGDWKLMTLPNNKTEPPQVAGLGFSKDNNIYYFASNHDLKDEGTTGLFSYNFSTDKITKLFRHPDVDLASAITGRDGEVIGVNYEAGYPDYYYLEDESVKGEVAFHKSIRASFKGQAIGIGTYTKDRNITTISVRSDKNPGDYYLIDRRDNKVTYVASRNSQIDPKLMAAVEPFTMTARDGLKMYGLMTIPNGKELKDLPMVIYPHGGPYGPRDRWGFDNRAQLLAHHGYLVVQLDFRGSGGYGKKFEKEGYTYWGTKMQDDITDATKWAINQGYADKDRICIHGVSYGGYASMQAVVREPDLYKCTIPDAGIYEVELQWKKADSFKGNRKARQNYFKQMFGTYEDQAVLDSRSPALNLENLKADIFLVHGTEDVRVPIENAYFLEKKLKEKGVKYKTMYKKDGHGFQKIPHRLDLYKAILKFLKKHIGD